MPCTTPPSTWTTGYGGTSFAAPIWAGIQALINETNRGRPQGNPNYRLYRIANTEYGADADEPCNSTSNPQAWCVFYDVTVNDSAVPCIEDSATSAW